MVKEADGPRHPVEGVTVIVAVIGDDPGLAAMKDGIFPVPLAGKPIAVLVFVQVYVVPVTELLNTMGPVGEPAQKSWLPGTVTSGAGVTFNWRVTVVVPHSLVTDKVIVYEPAVLYCIGPGMG